MPRACLSAATLAAPSPWDSPAESGPDRPRERLLEQVCEARRNWASLISRATGRLLAETKESTVTRAVGYVRVSKADRDKTDHQQRLSIRTQREQINRACTDRGLDLVDIMEDFAASGADDDRVDYQRVLALVADKQADLVVVTRLDRLSRKAWRLLWLLDEQNLNVLALEQCFDTGEPEGWLSAAIHSIMSDYERRLIGKRTKQALAQLRREGIHTGRPSEIPVEVEDRIAALHDEGMSASAIAALLESEGVAHPTAKSKAWHHSHVLAAVRRVEVRRQAVA